MKKTLLSMLGLMTAGMVSAQVYITDVRFDPNGVNNEVSLSAHRIRISLS